MMDSDSIPDEVIVSKDRSGLRLVWSMGHDLAFEAGALRAACRCAWCTRDRILDRFADPDASLVLASVDALGSHGLHLKFSDGHERGIFPWAYLRKLAEDNPATSPSTDLLTGADGARTGPIQ